MSLIGLNVLATLTDDPLVELPSHNTSDAARPSNWSRRRLLKSVLGIGALGASGVYAREVEPFWVEWHDHPMPVPKLPKAFDGFRILQLTDLHASNDVP